MRVHAHDTVRAQSRNVPLSVVRRGRGVESVGDVDTSMYVCVSLFQGWDGVGCHPQVCLPWPKTVA